MRLRKVILLLIGVSGLTSCGGAEGLPSSAYQRFSDRLKVALGMDHLLGGVCQTLEGDTAVGLPADECYRVHPRQRYRGVWLNAREFGTCFVPNAISIPEDYPEDGCIELDMETRLYRQVYGDGDWNRRLMVLDFYGRQTIDRVPAGHLGMDRQYVIVGDELVSIRVLEEEKGPPAR